LQNDKIVFQRPTRQIASKTNEVVNPSFASWQGGNQGQSPVKLALFELFGPVRPAQRPKNTAQWRPPTGGDKEERQDS
jgi:hypothetical protein